MSSAAPLLNRDFQSLHENDTVAEAVRRMLADRVNDLPVVDAAGGLVGMFKLGLLLAELLPRGAVVGEGLPDLAFVSDSLDDLRARVAGLGSRPVRDFTTPPEPAVAPGVSPVEIVLLLYKGHNSIPVVDDHGRLVAMVTARDVLAALA